jgi:hypothetical protein
MSKSDKSYFDYFIVAFPYNAPVDQACAALAKFLQQPCDPEMSERTIDGPYAHIHREYSLEAAAREAATAGSLPVYVFRTHEIGSSNRLLITAPSGVQHLDPHGLAPSKFPVWVNIEPPLGCSELTKGVKCNGTCGDRECTDRSCSECVEGCTDTPEDDCEMCTQKCYRMYTEYCRDWLNRQANIWGVTRLGPLLFPTQNAIIAACQLPSPLTALVSGYAIPAEDTDAFHACC